jgi:hypothetical protein
MKSIDKMTVPELQEHIYENLIWSIRHDIFKSQVEHWVIYLLGRGIGPKLCTIRKEKRK